MEINTFDQYNLTAADLGVTQTPLNQDAIEKPEVLFESILINLLTQAVEMNNSENSGLLGSNGPWKDLIYTVLNESLNSGQNIGINQLLADSAYNNKLGD